MTMIKNNTPLFCVMGRSGSGKDTLVNKICKELHMNQIISYTTRPRRKKEGDTHIFTDISEYENAKNRNILAAYTEINGYTYWTTKDQLIENDFYIIDPDGVKTLKKIPNLQKRLVIIYIQASPDTRFERSVNTRGDKIQDFINRNASENDQFFNLETFCDYDYSICNKDLDKSLSILRHIIAIENGLTCSYK